MQYTADNISASQEISFILWDPKVHYHVCDHPPLNTFLSHLKSTPSRPMPLGPILVSYCHLRLGLTSCLFAWDFPANTSHHFRLCYLPRPRLSPPL